MSGYQRENKKCVEALSEDGELLLLLLLLLLYYNHFTARMSQYQKKHRLAASHGRFSRIRLVAAMYTPN